MNPISRLRVLVVDDDHDTAESTAPLLSLQGIHSACACNCDDAVAAATAEPPDVVLIDLAMPKADGCELARRLRELDLARAPVLIAVTGMASEWDRKRAFGAGFEFYLIKPVPPNELVSLLQLCEKARVAKV